MKQYLTGILAVLLVASVIMNGILFLRYSTTRPITTFNGETITKKAYLDTLEYQAGKQVLNKMVFAKLVEQAAKRAGVTATQAQVDSRLEEIQRREPQILPDPNNDATRYEQFKEDLATDISLENLRLQGVTVDEAEIQDYYQSHKAQFMLPLQVKTTMVVTENATDAGAAEADLRQGLAEDAIARQPGLHVVGVGGFKINMETIPAQYKTAISQAVLKTKPGEVTSVQLGKNYVTFKVKNSDSTGVPPLSKIHDTVARNLQLSKAPAAPVVLARLYKEAKPKFDSNKYQAYFKEVEDANAASASSK